MKGFQSYHELLNMIRFPLLLYTYKCLGTWEQDPGSSCTVERKPTPVIPTRCRRAEDQPAETRVCFGMCVPTHAKTCVRIRSSMERLSHEDQFKKNDVYYSILIKCLFLLFIGSPLAHRAQKSGH